MSHVLPANAEAWVHDQTVGSVLRNTAIEHPGGEALVFPALNLRWTWRDLDHLVDTIASAFLDLGIERGEHVGIWAMNSPEWVVAQFAVGRIGAVLVNINPAYRLYELEETLRMADVRTLIVGLPYKGSEFVPMVETLCPEVQDNAPGRWRSASLPELRRLVNLGQSAGPGWVGWANLEQARLHGQLPRRMAEAQPADVFNIQFTSGTTGMPKGAMLTHRNVLMNAFHIGCRLRYSTDDRVCVPVPFYHCFGCVLGTLVCAMYGATIVVPAPSFSPTATLAALDSERCTSVYGVPTMFSSLLDHPDRPAEPFPKLRTGIMAGSPCPLPLMKEVMNTLGAHQITIGYGQTEASPIITLTDVDDPPEIRSGTVGRPIPGVEVKLVDPANSREVPPGTPGELCARGHGVMAGYYKAPAATERVIDPEGWLHTGDLAAPGPEGTYRIVGRCKELIIRGGENIYPPQIEEFLHHHPAVAEVAVVGLPDAHYGEVVSAWIVPRANQTVTSEEILAFCEGQIARFKIPRYIVIVEALPKTVTGKIRKHVLRDQGIEAFQLAATGTLETA